MAGHNLPTMALAAMLFIATAATAQQFVVPPDLGNGPPPEVQGPSWRTDNFDVTAPSEKVARKIGRVADRCRKKLALLRLGKEAATWDEPCKVRVKLTDQGRNGSTSLGFLDGKVVIRSTRLEGSLDEVLEELPQQVTHTLLADWLGHPLPRWAEVGTAGLAEVPAVRARDHQWLLDNMGNKRFMSLRQLLPLHDYPKDLMAVYAEGLSLAEFLVRKGGRPKLLAFVARGERYGWDKAAEAQYGYAKVEDLEQAWLTRVMEGEESEGRE